MMPDSPLIYYEEEEFDKAKEIYLQIARWNGVKMEPFKFDEEAKEEEQHI